MVPNKLQWPLHTCQNNGKLKAVPFISDFLKYKNTTNKEFKYVDVFKDDKKYICEKHLGPMVAQIIH